VFLCSTDIEADLHLHITDRVGDGTLDRIAMITQRYQLSADSYNCAAAIEASVGYFKKEL